MTDTFDVAGELSPAQSHSIESTTVDAGVVALGSVGDFVWVDTDRDGVQDEGERGLGGVLVTLSGTDVFGNPVELSMSTDDDGSYLFAGLVPGVYTVTFGDAAGYGHSPVGGGDAGTDSNPVVTEVTLGAGQDVRDVDHGFVLGSIGDVVWSDLDGDGVQDEGEPGLVGVTVELLNSAGEVVMT